MNTDPRPDRAAAPKKPYKKPEIRHERIFETGAMACLGKHDNGVSERCSRNRKS
jgi:hypothetical protein